MKTPENVLYSKTHEWLRMEGDVAYVGITDFAQSELGDIVFLEIETVGETLAKDEVFGTIEAVKTVSDLLMPVSGTVLEVNPTLEENPAFVNTNPYDEGWLVKIQVTDVNETKELLTADQYQEII